MKVLAAVLVIVLASSVPAEETRLLRFPDIHADRVVFTYGGDLWIATTDGGTARRLTSHSGLELFAKFSPDGTQIAFTGQYGGDEQVYVMPAAGGAPRQLTWYPATGPLPPRWGYDHQVYDWAPDGSAVVFRSLRDAWGASEGRLYRAPVAGGLPQPLPMPVSGAGVYAGDDSRVFYSPLARDFRTWKRYQGGWAQDLWLFDIETGQARQLTDHPRTDRDPMWIAGAGYFASDRGSNGKLNLYRVGLDDGGITQLTAHADWDVRWPSAGPDGRIVYQHGGKLRVFDTRDGGDRGIAITVPDDDIHRRSFTASVGDSIRFAAISPTGARVLFGARGNLFNAPAGEGVVRDLTRRSGAHDREAAWTPDGEHIVFVSDASGEEALWQVPADGSSDPKLLAEFEPTRLYDPRPSPDGDHVAVADKSGNIHVLAADGSGDRVIVGRDTGWRNRDYTWSPDGRWLAFSLTGSNDLRALHVHDSETGRTRRISEGLFSEYRPAFSRDGALLYFLADREFAPQIARREWNFVTNRMTGIYAFALTDDSDNPFAPSDLEEPGVIEAGQRSDGDEDEADDESAEESTAVDIDFDGLAKRVLRVPVDASNFGGLHVVDGALLVLETDPPYYGRSPAAPPRIKRFDFDAREFTTLEEGVSAMDLSVDGNKLLIGKNGGWTVRDVSGNGDPETVATDGLVTVVDPAAEWNTAFDEVWRRFRDFFYVENMHGYDWQAIGAQYRELLPHVAHRSDLNDVMGQMIAELNVSHAYVSGGDLGLPERPDVALPGVRFELDAEAGRYRVARILPGQNDDPRYRSPLTEVGSIARAGEYVLAINGQPLTAERNPYQLLSGLSGDRVELTLSASADGTERRSVLFQPIDSEQPLHYLDFVTTNKQRVEEASDGRLGYLHIPDMGATGIREFIKWFYGQIDRDGLVIDVRANGGGNVSQAIIERLAREPLALGYSRTMPDPSTYPAQAFAGHLVALLNENSASDGDIFPYQFRNAGLGPLIGQRSWGGVVGITNHGPLIDGGTVFVPEFGFLDTDGEYVIEGEGVSPDIEVRNDPASRLRGEDRQLSAAIEYLLERLQEDPVALPERPEDPVKTP